MVKMLKRLHFPRTIYMRYPEDVGRILQILNERGFTANDLDIHEAWSAYSDSMAASWMSLDDDDDAVFACIGEYLVGEDD